MIWFTEQMSKDYFSIDFLSVFVLVAIVAPAQADSQISKITEFIEPPNVKKIIFKQIRELCISFQFANSQWSHYRGFILTYQPFGNTFPL